MIRQLAPERPRTVGPLSNDGDDGTPTGLVAAAAAVRGAAVAASGLLLTAGLALMLWAVTPSSGDDVVSALRGGVAAFAAANLMPVVIGGVTLTLPPLLLTVVIAGLFVATARRGRFLPRGRYQETVSILVTASVYGLIVAATTRGFGPVGGVPAGWVWTAAALALLSTGAGMVRRGSAWHDWWMATAPEWATLGVRGAGIGVATMIGGGGLALSVGLITHFGSGVAIAALAAPSWMDGLGMAMLGAAYVPNAVIAAVGYVSGVGFEIGPGTYSPLATSTVELPGVPLLAAAPDHAGRSLLGLAFLLAPAIAGYLIARPAIRNLGTRSERAMCVGVAASLSGALVAGAAAIARGGIGDGRWSAIGAPPLLLGAAVAVEIGVVAAALAGTAGGRAVPWRHQAPARSAPKRAARGAGLAQARLRQPAAAVVDRSGQPDETVEPAESTLADAAGPDAAVPDESVSDQPGPDDSRRADARADEPLLGVVVPDISRLDADQRDVDERDVDERDVDGPDGTAAGAGRVDESEREPTDRTVEVDPPHQP